MSHWLRLSQQPQAIDYSPWCITFRILEKRGLWSPKFQINWKFFLHQSGPWFVISGFRINEHIKTVLGAYLGHGFQI